MIINVNQSGYIPRERQKLLFFSLYINASTNAFDPTCVVTSGTLNWDLGDVSTDVYSNSFSHTYSTIGTKNVKVNRGTPLSQLPVNITSVILNSDNLVGVIDLNLLENLNYLELQTNADLTQIINPTSSQLFTTYNANNCEDVGLIICIRSAFV